MTFLLLTILLSFSHQVSAQNIQTTYIKNIEEPINIYHDSFSIVFSAPIQRINPDDIPIEVSPQTDCYWSWIDQMHLSCQLNDYSEIDEEDMDYGDQNRFQQATQYTIKLSEGLTDTHNNPVKPQIVTFINNRPSVRNVRSHKWLTPNQPLLMIDFNQKIKPSSLKGKVFLRSDGDNIALEIVNNTDDSDLNPQISPYVNGRVFLFKAQQAMQKGSIYQLHVDQGVTSENGPVQSLAYHSDKQFTTLDNFAYISHHCFKDYHARTYSAPCYADDGIKVIFSSFIDPKSLKNCGTNYQMKTGRHTAMQSALYLMPRSDASQLVYKNVLSDCIKTLFDEFGRPINPVIGGDKITTQGIRPSLTLNAYPHIYAHDEEINLQLTTVNIDEYFLTIEKINNKVVNIQHKVTIDHKKQQKQTSSLPLHEFADNIQSIKGHISLMQTDIDSKNKSQNTIAFLAQKSPYLINFKHNSNHAVIQINTIETSLSVAHQQFSLTHKGQTYHDKTDENGVSQLSLRPTETNQENTTSSITIDANGRLPAVTISGINNHSMRIASQALAEDDYHEIDENAVVIYGLTDKPIYRPGETVKFKLFMRQKQDKKFIIAKPQFKVFANHSDADCWDYEKCRSFYVKEVDQLDQFGGFSGQFDIPKSANDGHYSIGIILKDAKRWDNYAQDNNLHFHVSHFKDSAHKLTLTSTIQEVKGRQNIPLSAFAEYYSGGHVSNEAGEIAGEVIPLSIEETFPEFDEYSFRDTSQQYGGSHFMKNLSYGNKGLLTATYTPPENEVDFGQIKINAGIKPKNAEWNYSPDLIMPYRQKDYFVGLKFNEWFKSTNKPLNLASVLIDHKGQKHQPQSLIFNIQKAKGISQWSSPENLTCKKQSKNNCQFTIQESGRYKVSVNTTIKNQDYSHEITFYVNTSDPSEISKPQDMIQISADKKSYNIGDTARITFNFPQDHVNAFITAERNTLINSWVKSTKNGQMTIDVEITQNHAPGFNVLAMIQPIDKNNALLDKSNNITYDSLTVDVKPPEQRQHFSINTDQKVYHPKQEVRLNITSHFPQASHYVVAVIDQSIVDLVDKKSLYNFDEYSYKRAQYHWSLMKSHQVLPNNHRFRETSIFKDFPQYRPRVQYFQASNDFDSETEEVDSITVVGSNITRVDLGAHANDIKGRPLNASHLGRKQLDHYPTIGNLNIMAKDLRSYFAESAYFNTDVFLDPESSTELKIVLPDNLTQWRIVVLGTDETGKLEFNQTTIIASKDLELRSTLPLQLTQGDQFIADYTVISKTRKKAKIHTAIKAQQNNSASNTTAQTFNKVKKLSSQSLSLVVDPVNTGPLQMTAIAKTKKNADGLANNIPVRSAEIKWSETQYGQLEGKNVTLTFNNAHQSTDNAELSVQVTNSLLPHLEGVYHYMKNYPHQCWEQQSAKAIIAAIEIDSNPSLPPEEVAQNKQIIKQVLRRAQDFQAPDGGMTFFSGKKSHVNRFLSLNTLENLNFLSKLGYSIPQTVYDRLADYINQQQQNVESDWQSNSQSFEAGNGQISPALQLYAFNLSTEKNTTITNAISDFQYQNRKELNLFALSQLLSFYRDDAEKRKQLQQTIAERFYSTNKKYTIKNADQDHWFNMPSAIKDQCHLISQQLQLNSTSIDKNALFKHINGVLDKRNKKGHFGSTLENAYCSKALFQFAKRYENSNQSGSYFVDINDTPHQLIDGQLRTTLLLDQELSFDINNPSQHNSYYQATISYPIPAETLEKQANGFNIQRQYFTFNNGQWQKSHNIKTGDWIKTVITIHSPIGRKFVAVSNPVPGGWLPTDTNLASNMPVGIRSSESPKDNSPDFYERQLNPDTTRFYADYLTAGTHHISYYSQVRNAGKFMIMPAVVEEMYDDEIRATTESREVIINK